MAPCSATSQVRTSAIWQIPAAEVKVPSGERVVLGRKPVSGFVKVKWTDAVPEGLYRLEEAEELGARWEGDELVTYDYDSFVDLFSYYERNEYLPDND